MQEFKSQMSLFYWMRESIALLDVLYTYATMGLDPFVSLLMMARST